MEDNQKKYCPFCGEKLFDERRIKYCPYCGKPLYADIKPASTNANTEPKPAPIVTGDYYYKKSSAEPGLSFSCLNDGSDVCVHCGRKHICSFGDGGGESVVFSRWGR